MSEIQDFVKDYNVHFKESIFISKVFAVRIQGFFSGGPTFWEICQTA